MNDYIAFSAYFGAALTLIIYVVSFRISDRIGHPLANPILICLALLIGALLIFDIDYDAYNQSARYITYLLTPATACLALPLYRQIQKLREYPLAIVAGILTGVAVNALCVLAVALVSRLGDKRYRGGNKQHRHNGDKEIRDGTDLLRLDEPGQQCQQH